MLTFVIVALAGLASPAQAEAAPPVSQTTATAPAPRVICRRMADTGSNVRGRKVCLTARQWDQVARDSQGLGRSMLPALVTPNQ